VEEAAGLLWGHHQVVHLLLDLPRLQVLVKTEGPHEEPLKEDPVPAHKDVGDLEVEGGLGGVREEKGRGRRA
jgi:hypothetical protein